LHVIIHAYKGVGCARAPCRWAAGGADRGTVREPPPVVLAATGESIRTYEWSCAVERQAAMEHLAATATGDDRGPALLRGAAADWPAIHNWSLARLVRDHGDFLASVRVAAGPVFTFCELRHIQVLYHGGERCRWLRPAQRGMTHTSEAVQAGCTLAYLSPRLRRRCFVACWSHPAGQLT
jgi:hypothetical protein